MNEKTIWDIINGAQVTTAIVLIFISLTVLMMRKIWR